MVFDGDSIPPPVLLRSFSLVVHAICAGHKHCLLRSEWERTGKASKRKQTEPTAWVRNDRVGCAAIQAISDIMRYCYGREILSDL